MFNSIITTREKRTRKQEALYGPKPQKFVLTSYLGLQPIQLPEEKEQLTSEEELPIKVPRIGYISPVKRNEFGSYPKIGNLGVLFNDADMDFTIMELHRVREFTTWNVESRRISVVHDLWAQQYTQMVCWMIEACTKLRLNREAFQAAVCIALRYMNARTIRIRKVQFQLLAVSAIWIVYRLEHEPARAFINVFAVQENLHVKAHQFLSLFDSNYSPEDLVSTEKDVAISLQADFSLRVPYHWVNLYISYGKHLGKNPEVMTKWTEFNNVMKCYQLLDAILASMDLAEYKPSLVAAAALCVVHPEDSELVLRLSSAKVSELTQTVHYVKWLCSDYMDRWDRRQAEEGEDHQSRLPATVDEQFHDHEMVDLLNTQRDSLVRQCTKKKQPTVILAPILELPTPVTEVSTPELPPLGSDELIPELPLC